jgi:putative transposase
MRTLLHTILQALVDAEATGHLGAGMHEQNDTRTTQRNGTRTKVVSATSGDLSVKIAKTRTESFFATLLHPRPRIDVALHAVVMEAYVHGVSTRKVDDLVAAMGAKEDEHVLVTSLLIYPVTGHRSATGMAPTRHSATSPCNGR